MTTADNDSAIYQRPVELLQRLIRFDTTNPPGNESECIALIKGILAEVGIDARILARSPERPNLIARLPGQGKAAPLLLYGHIDVVTTENQAWQHPPFEGKLVDGYVWGRGALDMKGGIAMLLTAFLRAKAEGMQPAGDIVLTVVSDEEAGGDFGAMWLVNEYPEEFRGIHYALGEFGGFSMGTKPRLYPIMVSEKQVCWMKATLRGPGGHGSTPVRGGAMAKLARFLHQLDTQRLPVHITPEVRLMFEALASALGGISGKLIGQLLNPRLTNRLLGLLGERGHQFDPLLHNTVSPTVLHGSSKINVIPGEVAVELDGRTLPGFGPDDLIRELRGIVGDEVEFELIHHDPGPSKPDMGFFNTLVEILKEADPEAVPIPFIVSGFTDARCFSKLGIQTYGFLPMKLPDDFNFMRTIHGADERIPAEAIEFGANAIYKALQRFGI